MATLTSIVPKLLTLDLITQTMIFYHIFSASILDGRSKILVTPIISLHYQKDKQVMNSLRFVHLVIFTLNS